MNFVDVQPDSFLDYAFTSPTPRVMNSTKFSRTNRKQNRCCDQCRKGKRACNAAILEDALLDDTETKEDLIAFHYSDVFGPLAPCNNCAKTKKACTFEWLRSQRLSQSKETAAGSVHDSKRRRTSTTILPPQNESVHQHTADYISLDIASAGASLCQLANPFETGDAFVDFATGTSEMMGYNVPEASIDTGFFPVETFAKDKLAPHADMSEGEEVLFDNTYGKGSPLGTISEPLDNAAPATSPSASSLVHEDRVLTQNSGVMTHTRRKRRRAGYANSIAKHLSPCPTLSLAGNLVRSANNAVLTESLLKIYHNSFENALSCWVTERTCPYINKDDVTRLNEARPEWNRIYHHVFRLDRLAANIRGRPLTFAEDQAAAKALNFSIYAFATQWAQSSERCNASYPFDVSASREESVNYDNAERSELEFDRVWQINAWEEARNALHAAVNIESFRVVLAQIVFALTQKPVRVVLAEQRVDQGDAEGETLNVEKEVDVCDDLLSKLNLAINEGPPTHLEQGLRLIHSLRSRVAMRNADSCRATGSRKQYRCSTGRLDESDRETVDLLFWLGIMFDTLSSAVHNRPLVVSDEDSNIYPNRLNETRTTTEDPSAAGQAGGIWDGHLFAHQNSRLQAARVRWPCSFDQAAALLCDAAPIKVLLFRKVTNIQTLVARGIRGQKIEASLHAALDVVAHWTKLYAPFIQDCIQHHDRLHPRIQSWYTCLAGHWHLAALLLGDLIEMVDLSERGVAEARSRRESAKFVAHLRRDNCQIVSDMAERACPRVEGSFSHSGDFHFALNKGSILTEPWTAILIRVFAKAGVMLLEADDMLPPETRDADEENFQRANQCVKALWYLGRKSDMARSAADILGTALRGRQKDLEEKVSEMS